MMISIIIPTYNRPDSLVRAIESIFAQTYDKFEIIVINDCGEDVSDLLRKMDKNGNIRYLAHETNRGPSASRNTGIVQARGKYIAYLDDDDIYYPNHLETLVNFLESGNYKVAYTDLYRISHEKKDGEYVIKSKDVWSFNIDYDWMLVGNVIPVLSVMHEKSCLNKVGMFDESLWLGEEWDLWIRMSRQFKFAHIKKITAEFSWKLDETNISSNKRAGSLRSFAYIYDKHKEYAKDKPRIIKQQQKVLKELSKEVTQKDWARREKLKIFLARIIGIKGIDFLYRIKLKLFH